MLEIERNLKIKEIGDREMCNMNGEDREKIVQINVRQSWEINFRDREKM